MKRNQSKLYAKALSEIIFEGVKPAEEKKIVDNFLKLLEKSGQQKKAKEILDITEDLLLAKRGKRKIIFHTARKMTADQKKILRSFIKDGDTVTEKIEPELIAGIKIIINDSKQFDASMQSKLKKII